MTAFPSLVRPIAAAVRQAIVLRDYQATARDRIYGYWAQGFDNVLAVLPTGAGKTILFASILADHRGGAVAIAHRQELVSQISLALNMFGVRHRIIAPKKVRELIIAKHLARHKITHYDANAPIGVAGVDSLKTVKPEHARFASQVTLWVQDEAHHVLKENKWGKVTLHFGGQGVKGLGVTASPRRADGQGLGRATDGLFDAMVVGPSMRDLIDDGYLTPYQIRTVPCKVDYSQVKIGASGEYVHAKLVAAEDAAEDLVGDIVAQYLKYARGKRGVTFVSSVERAERVAEAFRQAGVPALALDGNSSDDERDRGIQALEAGTILQLVNCDLFGEGFDLPAIEVVSMGTKTASLSRYMQWFGRVLRLMLNTAEKRGYDGLTAAGRKAVIAGSVKPFGLVIDHGANLLEHDGPPDIPRVWSLGRYGNRGGAGAESVPYRICLNPGLTLTNPAGWSWEEFRLNGWTDSAMTANGHAVDSGIPCAWPYPKTDRCCPACSYLAMPQSRKDPEHVDGDLQLLDEETLAALFENRAQALLTSAQFWEQQCIKRVPQGAALRNTRLHEDRLSQLGKLGEVMGYWGGHWRAQGYDDVQLQRRFYAIFGVDVLTAAGLKREPAEALTAQVRQNLLLDGVVIPD